MPRFTALMTAASGLTTLLFAPPAAAQMEEQAQRQYEYCREELTKGAFERAITSAESALRLDASLYDAFVCKALGYEGLEQWDKAWATITTYIDLTKGITLSDEVVTLKARIDEAWSPSSAVGTAKEGKEATPKAVQPTTGPYAGWDPEVFAWGADRPTGALIVGGFSLGMFIAGDQLAYRTATDIGGVLHRSPVGSMFVSLNHLPYGSESDPVSDAYWGLGYFSEFLFTGGVALALPGLIGPIPGLVGATAGADLRTVKALSCFGGGLTLAGASVTNLIRFSWLHRIELENHSNTGKRFHFLVPGITSLTVGVTTAVIGGLDLLFAILYAADAVPARAGEGLWPGSVASTTVPWMAPVEGGAVIGFAVRGLR